MSDIDPAVPSTPARSALLRARTLTGNSVVVLGIPLLILSQWLAVKWALPTRQVFNAWLVAAAVLIIVTRPSLLLEHRKETAIGFGLAAAVGLSAILNGVALSVLVRGTVPYAAIVVFLLAGLVSRPSRRTVEQGALVGAGSVAVMGLVAIPQLLLGEPAFRWFGQDLEYPRWWERGRATGLVANPGRLGQLGLLGIGLLPHVRRAIVWVAAGTVVAVAASGARVALGAAVVIALVSVRRRREPAYAPLFWGALASIALFAMIQVAVPAARDDLVDRTETTLAELADEEGVPDDLRILNMRASLRAWQAHPIVGTGPGRFGSTTAWATKSELHDRYGLPDTRSEEFLESLRAAGDDREIDVGTAQLDLGWFQILAELGVIGLAGVVALLAVPTVAAVRRRRLVPIVLVVTLAILTLVSPGLVDFSLAGVMLWWIGASLTVEAPK